MSGPTFLSLMDRLSPQRPYVLDAFIAANQDSLPTEVGEYINKKLDEKWGNGNDIGSFLMYGNMWVSRYLWSINPNRWPQYEKMLEDGANKLLGMTGQAGLKDKMWDRITSYLQTRQIKSPLWAIRDKLDDAVVEARDEDYNDSAYDEFGRITS